MKSFFTTTAALALLTSPAFAQEVTFAEGELDYSSISNDDGDASFTELDGGVEYSINQFLLGADLSSGTLSSEGDTVSTTTILEVFAGYMVTPEVLLGAGLTSVNIDFEGGGEAEADGYEVFAQYRTDQFGVAINYAEPNSDVDDFSITGLYGEAEVAPGVGLEGVFEQVEDEDGGFYSLAATYDSGPIMARAFTFGNTDVDDSSAFGVRGGYDITPQIALLAGFASAEDLSSFSAGGSYAIADGLSAEAMIGTLEAGDLEVTTIDFKFTYTLGERKRLDNVINDNVADDGDQVLGVFGQVF